MRTFKLLAAIVILVLLLIFSAYNAQPVQIRFLAWQTGDLPLFLPILFCFFLGFLAAALLGTIRSSQRRRQLGQREKAMNAQRPGGGAREPENPSN